MAELGSAQVLGGIAVEIGGDLSKLRAAVATTKNEARAAEQSIKITIPVAVDASRLRAEASRAAAAAAAGLSIRVPLLVDSSAARAQIAQLQQRIGGGTGVGSGGSVPGGGSFDRRWVNSRVIEPQLALPAPGEGTAQPPKPPSKGWIEWLEELGKTSAKTTKAVAGVAKVLLVAQAVMSTGTAVLGTAKVVGQISAGAGEDEIAASREDVRGAIRSIPLAGGIIDDVGHGIGSGINYGVSSVKNVFATGRFESDYQYAERTQKATGKEDEKTAKISAEAQRVAVVAQQTQQLQDSARFAQSTVGKTQTESGVIAARQALEIYDRDHNVTGKSRGEINLINQGRTAIQQQEQLAVAANDRGIRAEGLDAARGVSGLSAQTGIIGMRAAAMRLGVSDSDAGTEQGSAADRAALMAGHLDQRRASANNLDGLRTAGASQYRIDNATELQAAEEKKQQAELAQFDEQAAQQREQRKRQRAVQAVQTAGVEAEGALRIAKQGYAADLVAFDTAADARLKSLTDATDRENEVRRTAAQRAVMVAQQEEQQASNVRSMQSAGQIATLQANHQGYDAQLKAFDEESRRQREQLRSDKERETFDSSRGEQRRALEKEQGEQRAGNIDAAKTAAAVATLQAAGENYAAQLKSFDEQSRQQRQGFQSDPERAAFDASRVEQRKALQDQQAQDKGNLTASLDTRRQQARARGGGEGELANVLGIIGDEKSELRNATNGNQGDIRATQIEELKALKSSYLRPKSYATEFDSSREIAGGPDGEAGKEMVDVLKSIDQRLQQLTAGGN